MEQPKPILLGEEKDSFFSAEQLKASEAEEVYVRYGKVFEVEFPSPINQQRYRLRPKGYVGTYPLENGRLVRVSPKVPIGSIFQMLEYAYDLESFKLLEGQATSATLDDVFESLASILANRVTDRVRRGLRKDYVEKEDELPYVRGRVLIRESLRASLGGVPRIACQFEHHTPELEDNHILAYTLAKVRRFEFKRGEVASAVANAARMLAMTVDVREVDAKSCIGRFYDRMNSDYQPMHALCRFFLEHCGPADAAGSHDMLPFSLYMPGLFEAFVSRWLEANLDEAYRIESQFHADIDDSDGLFFRIDLILRDAKSDKALAVLDTKYKAGSGPSQSDIQQVVAYAARMRTNAAALIYPTAMTPSQFSVGDVTVHLLGFDLASDLGSAGEAFRTHLVEVISDE